ncbi:uncharacterized protein [Chaetodon trifascialis]|uniref:uncharacterized protein n=1 Tax=Chaetodon trifascialis TaxID=109706 RepID=UPI003996C663
MEAIKEAVWSYLQGLPDDLLTALLDELGVASLEDLTLLEENDLVKYLKPIQCRKLLNGIKQEFPSVKLPKYSSFTWPIVQLFKLSKHCKLFTAWQAMACRLPGELGPDEGMGGAERAEPLMEKTYIILRKYLNSVPAPAMVEIKAEWPFLFSQRGLYSHICLLTDIAVLSKLEEALNHRGCTFLLFCQQLDKPAIKEVQASFDPEASEKAASIFLLLLTYFKKPKENILLEADPCATAADVQRTAALPTTPCLNIQGYIMRPSAWMLSIEGEVVMGPHPNAMHGVAAFFSSFYTFNLEYPAVRAYTLEFIQRSFCNPDKRSKSRKSTTINPQVSTLLRKIIDFEWST